MVVEECACGEVKDVKFDNNVECNWSYYGENIIYEPKYDSQCTTSGETGTFYKDVYLYRCAVTDPNCGFGVLVTYDHEWDEETCTMTSYESWKLGYSDGTYNADEGTWNDDGTYLYEIKIETGSCAYHDYEIETSEDGNTVTATCKTCGSTYMESNKYDANGYHIGYTREATNTLSDINGELKHSKESWEDTYYMGYDYPVYSYYGWTRADGYEYFDEYEYVYDWEKVDCTRIVYHTSSSGTYEPYTEDCHKTGNYESEWTHEGSCSQPYEGWYKYTCPVCLEVYASGDSYASPNGHDYHPVYSEDNSEILYYECYDCGLQNYHGSDGTIIMEDFTEEYGNGENYVIGYYIESNVDYTYEVCAVVETEAGQEAIPVDAFTAFTELSREDGDAINAISFNKAAVAAAIEAMGYTDYDVQFVMVPYGSDGDLDYAITLTDETIPETGN